MPTNVELGMVAFIFVLCCCWMEELHVCLSLSCALSLSCHRNSCRVQMNNDILICSLPDADRW